MERQVCRMLTARERYALVRVSREWRRRYLPEACICHGSIRYGQLIYSRLDRTALRNMDPRMAWEIVYQIWQTGRAINGAALGLPTFICDGFLKIPGNIDLRATGDIYCSPYWYHLPETYLVSQVYDDITYGTMNPNCYRKWIAIINKVSLTINMRIQIITRFAIMYPWHLSDFLEKIWHSLGPDPRSRLLILDAQTREMFNTVNSRYRFWPMSCAI